MPHPRLAALALTTALATTGCGSSSTSSSSSSSSAMTREQFMAGAETICARLDAHIKPLHNTNFAQVAPVIVGYERAALIDMQRLTPPASLAEDWKQIVTDEQMIAEDTAKLGEYSKANNTSATLTIFHTAEKLQQQMLATATRDGFRECSHFA
jgi:hypothetical protein